MMRKRRSSLTAAGIAIVRAVESEKPESERICYDPYARAFLGKLFYRLMMFFIKIGYAEFRGPGVGGYLVARCRYIDDYLQYCIKDGIEQLVILGAGYDSRAYRFDELKGHVKVFEVDHPATQREKVEKVRKIFGKLPEHVVYVPVDFNVDKLETRLKESGYDERLKTLFIWEGVVYYLETEAVDDTLCFIAGHSRKGSSVIFDYTYSSVINGTYRHPEISSMKRYNVLTGEGLIFGIEEGKIADFLRGKGFDGIVNVTGDDLKRMYFKGPNEKRAVAPYYAIVHGTAKPEKYR